MTSIVLRVAGRVSILALVFYLVKGSGQPPTP